MMCTHNKTWQPVSRARTTHARRTVLQVFALCEALYEEPSVQQILLPFNNLDDMAAQALARLIQVGGRGTQGSGHRVQGTRFRAQAWGAGLRRFCRSGAWGGVHCLSSKEHAGTYMIT